MPVQISHQGWDRHRARPLSPLRQRQGPHKQQQVNRVETPHFHSSGLQPGLTVRPLRFCYAPAVTTTAEMLTTFRSQLPHLPRALGLVWHAARRWTAAWSFLLVIQGLLPVAMVYLTRTIVDRIAGSAAVSMNPESLGRVIAPVIVLAALYLTSEILRAATRLVRIAQADLVRDHVSALIHHKTIEADLAQFESPEFHDRLHRARRDSHEGPISLVQSLGSFVQSSITLGAMAIVLASFGWWVPLALAASTVPALVVVTRYALAHHRWTIRTTPEARRSWYYDWALSTRETAAELRLFDLGPLFSGLFQRIRFRLRRERFALSRAEALAEISAGGFALVVTGSLVIWMITRTVGGGATLGSLAMFIQAFYQGQTLMRSLLETVGQTWSNILFLDNLFGFLDVNPTVADPDNPRRPPSEFPPSIRFRSVTFTYPGTANPVFQDLDLEIRANSTAALLGVNGTGKTTLFKLACRFYDPDRGSVEIGGTDVRQLELSDVRRLVTALFQEPVHYSETAGDNVAIAESGLSADDRRVAEAIRLAGAETLISKLPQGLNTMLGTWFSGGTELSVGEWQRLALARALVRAAPVLLLDEPTSALDSWAEAEWAARLHEMSRSRTVVVITHRLTTAMHADRIHIMDEGRIVESGSHQRASRGRRAVPASVGRTVRTEFLILNS